MPFPFVHVCDLLNQAEKTNDRRGYRDVVSKWFAKHRRRIDHPSNDIAALFSTLLPEKRTDRVYNIRERTLLRIVGRALGLGVSRLGRLRQYEQPGRGEDLADCVESIVKETASPLYNKDDPVSVEEIDVVLHGIAANCHFSAPHVRRASSSKTQQTDLHSLYLRLGADEAKWLTRLVLKTYDPVVLDPGLVYNCYDSRLPVILKVRDNLDQALQSLREQRASNPLGIGETLRQVKPVLGTKVGRQLWLKGRSIKHCVDMSPKRISCEKKMDGEYCQIHIDLSRGSSCIQIFSKSGKDSTQDRVGVHQAIRDSLDIGRPRPRISTGCILEGELVVYHDKHRKIQPFHKIRRHVQRSGVFLGTELDSPTNPDEHLMIVYFDALSIDGDSLLGLRQTERFRRLRDLVNCRAGHAELVERQIIDLDRRIGISHLRKAFADSIVAREEGLVIKPDEPYFVCGRGERTNAGCSIKLKKEYIGNFGDIGDFAVVGARYDPVKAKSYGVPGVKWTHFFLGCLTNKDAVNHQQARPCFTLIDAVELSETLLKTVMMYSNPNPVASEDNDTFEVRSPARVVLDKGPTTIFTNPLVFDMRCFSFDKPGNMGFWVPRFPQVSKVHFDRSYLDTVSFSELQSMAEDAKGLVPMDDSQELLQWIKALEGADPRGIAVDAVSQLTASSLPTPSPRSAPVRQSQASGSSPVSPLQIRRANTAQSQGLDNGAVRPLVRSVASTTFASATAVEASLNPEKRQHATMTSPDSQKADNPKQKRDWQTPILTPRQNKRRRLSSSLVRVSPPRRSAASPQLPSRQQSSSQTREPLATMDINHSPTCNRVTHSQPSLPVTNCKKLDEIATPLGPTHAHRSGSMASQLPRHQSNVVEPPRSADQQAAALEPDNSVPTGSACRHAGRACMLRNRDILLAPCIASQPLITENLLSIHGITGWATDPREWVRTAAGDRTIQQESTPPKSSPPQPQEQQNGGAPTGGSRAHGSIGSSRPRRSRRRKICFVERRRDQVTQDFVTSIQALDLRLPRGDDGSDRGREYVEVYDWRVLEGLEQHEKTYRGVSKKAPAGKGDLWKKWFVALI